jgi:hypothetical protein
VADAGLGADAQSGGYGYRFDDEDATRVSFIVERGTLREVSVIMGRSYGPEDTLIVMHQSYGTNGPITDQRVDRGRTTGLHVPLVVGEWAKADVATASGEDAGPARSRPLRLRVLGDTAEAELTGEPALLRGECVWGHVDTDAP